MTKNDLVLRAARRERTERTPVWLMRQAGRFDPEYRAIRQRNAMPLEAAFRTPELSAEISLLPKRFGVDAIIFFQDILTPLAPMGAEFLFRPGPVLETPIRTRRDVDALRSYDPADELPFVAETLRVVRESLDGELPLLGFAGAPLTLAFFMIEGCSPGTAPHRARAMMNDDPATFRLLLDRLADMTIDYLSMQIESGVDAVQLFESSAGLVTPFEYRAFAHPYQTKILSALAGRVPTILFAKSTSAVKLMASTGADVLSVGSCVDLEWERSRFGDRVAFQGNVDNHLVATGTPAEVVDATHACLRAGGGTGHILNLGHGLLKDTPVENVLSLIEACKTFAHENATPRAVEA